MKENIRLLIVDDSKVMRDAIADMFSYGSNIQVVGQAANGEEAIEAIELTQPDVITLDVAMPVMDGITALKHIMIKNPIPTVMLSSLTLEGARVAFDALRYGAVDFIAKPSALHDTDLSEQEADIRSKIEYASDVEVDAIKYIRSEHHNLIQDYDFTNSKPEKVVAIGTAEGGYGALLKIIPHLTADIPFSYLVTMYTIREHVDAFASYLNNISAIHVKRAAHDEVLRPGVVYLNSGLDYTTVHEQADELTLHVSPAPFASRKGAIDMLMFSAAGVVKENAIGIVLSGTGVDGSEGLEEVARMGGVAIAQDQMTSLCKTMPGTASERAKNSLSVADKDIAETIYNIYSMNSNDSEKTG